jgi:hypothetical protein
MYPERLAEFVVRFTINWVVELAQTYFIQTTTPGTATTPLVFASSYTVAWTNLHTNEQNILLLERTFTSFVPLQPFQAPLFPSFSPPIQHYQKNQPIPQTSHKRLVRSVTSERGQIPPFVSKHSRCTTADEADVWAPSAHNLSTEQIRRYCACNHN